MILKRVLMPTFLLGIIFGLSGVAQAQYNCSTTAVPIPRVTKTGHTEPMGNVTVNCVPTGALSTNTATFTINYGPGATIANRTNYPLGKPITLASVAPTGNFTAGNTTITSVAGSSVTVQIAPIASTTANSSFTVSNVLASPNAAGTAEGGSLSAVLTQSSIGTDYTLLSNTGTVASAALSGIVPAGVTVLTTGAVTNSGIVIGAGNFSVKITENYQDVFQSQAQFNGGSGGSNTNSVQLKLTFTGIQPGETLTGCAATSTSGTVFASPTTLSSLTPDLVVNFTSNMDLNNIDSVTVGCAGVNPGTISTTFPPITMQVTLAPTGNAGIQGGAGVTPAPSSDLIPRYQASLIPAAPVTVIGTSSLVTDMLIPYAILGSGLNTGIAISNTTLDPFGTANGGATPTSGTITFQGFGEAVTASGARTPVTFTVNEGAVAPGTTKSILLSQILTDAGVSTTGCGTAGGLSQCFTGYIFVITNFTNAHGAVFIADVNFGSGSTKFSQAVPMLILSPVTAGNPRTPFTQTTAEQLDQ
jgi:hypothetical protein